MIIRHILGIDRTYDPSCLILDIRGDGRLSA